MSNMMCPKCGKFQEKADICVSCGIAIAKFRSNQTKKIIPKKNTSSQGKGLNKVFLVVAVMIVFVGITNLPEIIRSGSSIVQYERPSILDKTRKGSGIKQVEFMTLFDANRPFKSLAKENYYTVVEGYINTCSICKRMEAGFPEFLKARKDVLIRRVHFPEGGMNFSFTGETQEEVEKEAQAINEKIKSYDFCGTPHVEIYGANKELIVADSCSRRPATEFLRKWMSAET